MGWWLQKLRLNIKIGWRGVFFATNRIPRGMQLSVETAAGNETADEGEFQVIKNLPDVRRERICIHGGRRETRHISNPDLRPVYTSQAMFLPIEIP
jgi:hypothetical protein